MVAGSVAAMFGCFVVRRLVPLEELRANHELGGVVFAVLGTAYAVLLSFVIVVAWQQLTDADQKVTAEAGDLGSLYWIVSAFPADQSQLVQNSIGSYTRVVIDEEWPLMARGQESDKAWMLHDQLWKDVFSLRPGSGEEARSYDTQYSQALAVMSQFDQSRRARLLSATEGIPRPLWTILIAAGVVLVLFTYLLGTRRMLAQILMTGVLAALVSTSLVVAVLLNHPYAGDVRVSPAAFQSILNLVQSGLGK